MTWENDCYRGKNGGNREKLLVWLVKVVEMYLMPNVFIPKEFRMSEFVKYTRT